MSSPLRELFAIFDVDTKDASTKLKGLNSTIDTAKKGLTELAKTALAAFSVHAVGGFVKEMIDLGSELNDTAEKLGVGTDELQKFQFAAGLSGVGAEEAGKALQFLNKNVGEALGGSKEAVQQFADLGVQIKDNGGDVRELGDLIPEVADAFAKMGSDQERTAAAMKLFGKSGANLLPLLKQGSEELKKLSHEFDDLGLGIDEDFIKKADEAGDRLDILKLGFRALKTRLAAEVLPHITALAHRFSQYVAWAIKVSKETYILKEAWVAMGIAGAVAFAKVAIGFAKTMGILKKAGGIETLISLGWIGLIVAALAGLFLVIEDIVVAFQGGDSVIANFLDDLFGVGTAGEAIDEVKKIFNEFMTEVEAFGPVADEMIKLFKMGWEAVKPILISIEKDNLQRMASALVAIIQLTRWFVSELGAGLQLFGRFANSAGGLASKLGLDFGADLQSMGKAFATTGAGLSAATAQGTVSASSFYGAERQGRGDMNVGDININVNGGPSNADTGRAVAGAMKGALGEADRRAAANALFRGGDDDE